MIRLAQVCIHRPKATVAIWLVLVAALGFVGSQITDKFSPSILVVKGTESSRAQDIATSRFGNSVLVPIMLQGPASQLDKQGPALVKALRARTDSRVLSPWDKTGGTEELRPKPTVATIVTAVEQPEKTVAKTIQPQIDRTVHTYVTSPVKTYITGQPSIDRAMRHESISTTRTAVFIALPVLFVVCMLLFGSPVLGAVVAAFAGSVLAVGYGLTAIVAGAIDVDPVAVAGAAVLGLALSSAFALILVARWREEVWRHGVQERVADHQVRRAAAVRTAQTAGRTVLLAGMAMVVIMIISTELSTTEILNSVGIGATIMAGVAAAASVAVLPAALTLGGHHLSRYDFTGMGDRARMRLPRHVPLALIRHPVVIGLATFGLLAALTLPVLNFHSGPPDPKLLPSGNSARVAYEKVAQEMGPGWVTPFEVIVAKQQGTITTRKFLAELDKYQARIAKDPAVKSVVGPGAIATNANDLQGVPKGLNTAAKTAKKSKKDLKKLIAGLGQAGAGVKELRAGLAAAAGGAQQLNSGSGQAASGGSQLRAGLEQASAGSQKLVNGLDQASNGADQLKAGSAKAATGSKQLAAGAAEASNKVTAGLPAIQGLAKDLTANAAQLANLAGAAQAANSDVTQAAAALNSMTTGKADPQYAAAAAAIQKAAGSSSGFAGSIDTISKNISGNSGLLNVVTQQMGDLQKGLVQLKNGSGDLSSGVNQLAGGNSDLASGLHQLDAGGHALNAGLAQLTAGARQLESGLSQLHGGTGQLASGLSGGVNTSAPLQTGMGKITTAVVHSRAMIPSTKDLETLKKQSPHLFDSGYFVLAALEGAPTPSRQAAGFTVNVARGGAAGRVTVVPKYGVNDPRTQALSDRLRASAAAFAKATGTQAAVGGNAASLGQYHTVAASKLPGVIVGISVFTFLLLLVITRSLLLPLVAVAANLLTMGATLGALELLFGGDNPPLGGPGFTDPVTTISIVTVALGFGAIYEVFVLARARERYESGDTREAAFYGLNQTWAIITGVTLPMLAATVIFTPALLTIIREFAVGTLLAVAFSALVVRLFLLPAAIVLLGRFNWWMPRRLSRFVPRIHFRGPGAGAPPATTVHHKPN
jgi:RND superfamily putative drug exporter